MKKGKIVPEKSFLLCDALETINKTKSGIIVPKDDSKNNFKWYKVVSVGSEIEEFFKKGETILVDEENVNYVTFEGKTYYIISDNFVICKLK